MTRLEETRELIHKDDFQANVYVLTKANRHLCYNLTPSCKVEPMPPINALATFESQEQAKLHAVRAFSDFKPKCVSLETAREIALGIQCVSALVLVRNQKRVQLLFVR